MRTSQSNASYIGLEISSQESTTEGNTTETIQLSQK